MAPAIAHTMTTAPPPILAGPLQTEFVSFPNRVGLRVAACLDHTGGDLRARPWVLLAPKYGETKKNNLQLAHHLAANGLNILRFDHTNHVGESEGEMSRFTLPGAVEDILGAVDYLEDALGVKETGLVASSLSARMAIRAACHDPRVNHLVCLVGVVNVRRTLNVVYQEDVVANFLAGKRWGVNDVLGFPIHFEHFLGALVGSGLHTLEGTCAELAALRAPVVFLAASNDAWVEPEDVRRAAAAAPTAHLEIFEDAMHELRENPAVSERAFRQLVRLCVSRACGDAAGQAEPMVPDRAALLRQNKVERERLRLTSSDREPEPEFWDRYLSKYEFFENVDAYQYYISQVGGLLGAFRPGEAVLDAGCGNGLFGLWVARHLLTRAAPLPEPPVTYVGVDLTHGGLADALARHGRLMAGGPDDRARASLSFAYTQANFDEMAGSKLGFASETFDKICCSLLLSYLRRPEDLLRELRRLLRPGGVLVVSSMKPFCDLSEIYRRYVARGDLSVREVDSARALLSAAGKIKAREELGIYTFYPAEELEAMLAAAGFRHLRSSPSFGGQASVVRAEK
jgi:ubiquinone/menaquinone biosynthesis C-methylase UbiE/pimeloyl-ACP methyl ester carboxylesterase